MNSKSGVAALAIMAAIIALNTGLSINFVSASGRALAAAFNSQSIYLLAGVELALVLVAYVVSKNKPKQNSSSPDAHPDQA